MRLSWKTTLAVVALSGCSFWSNKQSFGVYFEPYSANIDQQAAITVRDAAEFAKANPLLAVTVSGFAAPPDPLADVAGLSAQRAAAVVQILLNDGVSSDRVTMVANE